MDYPPEFTSMVAPNSEAAQVKALKETFGAEPCSLADVLLLAPGHWNIEIVFRFVCDSLLEEGVSSEPVSEWGSSAAAN
jgi:hypothetical protein